MTRQTEDLQSIIKLAEELNIPVENAAFKYGNFCAVNKDNAYEKAVEYLKEYAGSTQNSRKEKEK